MSLLPLEPFPLLSLPREIRDHIYRFALLAPGQTPISCPRAKPFFKDYMTLPLNALLLLANRQIYSEASPILYGENIFNFATTDWFKPWYRVIGTTNQQLVRRLLITCGGNVEYFAWANALRVSGMSGLREVCITGHLSIKAYRGRHWTERTWEMMTDTFEEERMNGHLVEFGELEGIERKMFLIGFDEDEREKFLVCQAGWPVDMSDAQVEVLNEWYQYILDELAKVAPVSVVIDNRSIRTFPTRNKFSRFLGILLVLAVLAVGIWACYRFIR